MKERDINYWRGRCEAVERAATAFLQSFEAVFERNTKTGEAYLRLVAALEPHDEDQWEKYAERERARHRSEEPRGAPFDEDLGVKEGV
jgi:uncharacterized protein Yka (UPF0111/DUF47 family)